MRNALSNAIQSHTEFLREQLHSLIVFGMREGFPFETMARKQEEKRKSGEQMTELEWLYSELKIALEREQYEVAATLRDKILAYERGNNC